MVQFVLGEEVDEVFSRTKTEETAQKAGQKGAVTYHAASLPYHAANIPKQQDVVMHINFGAHLSSERKG